MNDPIPSDDSARLEVAATYALLGTEPEADFDDLARLASCVCAAPIALVGLLHTRRLWVKASVGIDRSEAPLESALWAHALAEADSLVVPDALADDRFARDPLVLSAPRIRFYAGVPLAGPEGHVLGALCVMDRSARSLTDGQSQALRALARQAVTLLELRRARSHLTRIAERSQAAEEARRASEELAGRVLESSRDCIKLLDLEGRLLSLNEGGMRLLEICDFAPLRNRPWAELWPPEQRDVIQSACATALSGGIGRFVGFCPTAGGTPKWWDVVVNAVLDAAGRPERLLAISRDVTERVTVEEMMRALAEATAAATGAEFFRSLAKQLALGLGARYAFIAECRTDRPAARMRAFWTGEGFGENLEYDVAATPCRAVLDGDEVLHARRVQEIFPEDKDLVTLGAESYLGLPIRDSARQVIGHLAVLDVAPLEAAPRALSVLRLFAARAGAELERLQYEERLRAALAEVESLKNRLHHENAYLQEEIRREHNVEEIVGGSPLLLDLMRTIEAVAPTDATVLITGETGTGKELVARAIHSRSGRRQRPLVKVNCGAIATGLVESELFGHVRGAFTGALASREGRFALADGGTLFLDEVGELPPETQVKLLRVLQEQEFEPVGGNRTVQVDVRVIAATNRDIEAEVRAGRFRSDLYYRLNVLPLRVPSLRERRSDIALLAAFFLSRLAKQFGRNLRRVSPDSLLMLERYDWPGNVRELRNVIERAVVLADGEELELGRDLLPVPARVPAAEATPPAPADGAQPAGAPGPAALDQVERGHILAVLERTGGVVEGPRGAARILGLHHHTLRSRMK